MRLRPLLFAAVTCLAVTLLTPGAWSAKPMKLTVDGDRFLLDGKPLTIIAGEMHYPRVPKAYWRDRMAMLRAMGCNTLCTYTFWNAHEPSPGKYDFSEDLDVAAYVKMAQEEDLLVILRPGPYVCSEWDFGGYPAWLLKTGKVKVRSTDPVFLMAAGRWLKRLGKELAPLQSTRGGPIILVQVENEYGSFGSDRAFMEATRKLIVEAGFDVQLYTADGPEQIPDGSLPDLPAAYNFGGGASKVLETVRKHRPTGPLICGEYWAGWFDHWGERHHTTDVKRHAEDLDIMLSRGSSVSIYMAHGGTNFGFTAGANDNTYQPDITSYDYDSPIDEGGRPAAKFFAFRDVIRKYLPEGETLPEVPAPAAVIEVPSIALTQSASLWSRLPKPVEAEEPLWMEALDQAYGSVLYRTVLPAGPGGELGFENVRDFATVYIDGKRVGELDRRLKQDRITLPPTREGAVLDVLVDHHGRINFGPRLVDDRKGVFGKVTLTGAELKGWRMYSLSFDTPEKQAYASQSAGGPTFFRGTLTVEKLGDTWLDMRGWFKGCVWLNGRNLGRFWSVGPQQTLFVPGVWLKRGANEVIVYDVNPPESPKLAALPFPILDRRDAVGEAKP